MMPQRHLGEFMRIVAFWAVGLAVLLAVAGLLFALVGFIGGNNIGMGVFGVLLIIVPLAGALWILGKSRQQGRPLFDAAARAIRPDASDWYDASGIAIDKQAGVVLLGAANGARTVQATSITEVSFVPRKVPRVYSTGIMALVGALNYISSASHNFSQAGLYVAAEGQRSRIIGLGEADAAKWQALLGEARGA